jgi:hypothetical protein
MEPAAPATSFLVGRDPPPQTKTAHLGEGQAPAPSGWAQRAFQETLIFLLACAFAWGLHRAGCDLDFAVITTYILAGLCFCLWKLELLRRDGGGDLAKAAQERRRVRLVAWALSLVWGSLVALRVASTAPDLAVRVALWVLAGIAMVLAFYFLFEARRGDYNTDDVESWPENDLHELSPEQRV